jgi:hypothetical protein
LIASACLTLAMVHLVIWFQQTWRRALLLFSIDRHLVAAIAACELLLSARRKALERHDGGRQDVQKPPRRLQFPAVFQGRNRRRAARHEFFYFGAGADLMALRYDDWKVSFKTIKGNLFNGQVETTGAPLRATLGQGAVLSVSAHRRLASISLRTLVMREARAVAKAESAVTSKTKKAVAG